MPIPGQGPLNGLRKAVSPSSAPEDLIAQRQGINQTMSGGMPPQPPISPQPQGGGMSPQERAMFGLQTGIPENPAAKDIDLPIPFEELMRRAQAIPGGPTPPTPGVR